jgi:hypothetical protein
MNRTILRNTRFGFAALALGGFAAWILPHPPGAATPMASAPAPEANTADDSPLAAAYRSASGEQRWLLVLSAAEHAAPAEFSTLIRMVRDEPFAVRLVAERWAERDPAGMFSSLYADFALPDTMPGTLPERPMLSVVLSDQWAKSDLPAAIKALTDAPEFSARNEMRWHVANQAFSADAEAGLRLWGEWGVRGFTPDTKRLEAWIARDPRHAAEAILGSTSGKANEDVLRQVGATWAKSDPAGALRFAATLEPHKRALFGEDGSRLAQRARLPVGGVVGLERSRLGADVEPGESQGPRAHGRHLGNGRQDRAKGSDCRLAARGRHGARDRPESSLRRGLPVVV